MYTPYKSYMRKTLKGWRLNVKYYIDGSLKEVLGSRRTCKLILIIKWNTVTKDLKIIPHIPFQDNLNLHASHLSQYSSKKIIVQMTPDVLKLPWGIGGLVLLILFSQK